MSKTLWIVLAVIIIGGGAYYFMQPMSYQNAAVDSGASSAVAPGGSATPAATQTVATTDAVNNVYMSRTDAAKGIYMTDPTSMTLYTYDKDTKGATTCYDTCAKNWPPYLANAGAQAALPQGVTLVARTDGSKQYAWNGMPLYYFLVDKKAGDITGDGKGGVWHIVKM